MQFFQQKKLINPSAATNIPSECNVKFIIALFFRKCCYVAALTVAVCCHIIINYKNKNWLQFLFIVKAAVLKQQISKFYPQIQRTEASDHIYFSQRPFINVKAIFCA